MDLWNAALDKIGETQGEENVTWFKGEWLFNECYLYRRIRQTMLTCKSGLKDYDPFIKAKLETCELGSKSVYDLVQSLCPLEKFTDDDLMHENFQKIMRVGIFFYLIICFLLYKLYRDFYDLMRIQSPNLG